MLWLGIGIGVAVTVSVGAFATAVFLYRAWEDTCWPGAHCRLVPPSSASCRPSRRQSDVRA